MTEKQERVKSEDIHLDSSFNIRMPTFALWRQIQVELSQLQISPLYRVSSWTGYKATEIPRLEIMKKKMKAKISSVEFQQKMAIDMLGWSLKRKWCFSLPAGCTAPSNQPAVRRLLGLISPYSVMNGVVFSVILILVDKSRVMAIPHIAVGVSEIELTDP